MTILLYASRRLVRNLLHSPLIKGVRGVVKRRIRFSVEAVYSEEPDDRFGYAFS